MMATAMPAAIRPYSMAVGPDSFLTKRTNDICIFGTPPKDRSGPAWHGAGSLSKLSLVPGGGQLGGDSAKQARQIGTARVHRSDDGNGDAGGDQAILDGRGARLVLDETRE